MPDPESVATHQDWSAPDTPQDFAPSCASTSVLDLVRNRARWDFSLGEELWTNLARGSLGSFALRVMATGLALASSIVLARLLGARGYGIYAYVMAVIAVLSIPAQLGLPTLLIRETAAYQVRAQWGRLRGLFRRANHAVLIACLIIGVLALALGWLFREQVGGEQASTFLWGLALLPLLALGALRAAALRGLRRVVLGMLPEEVLRVGLFLLLVGAVEFGFGRGALTAPRAMALQVLAAAVAFAAGAWLLMRHVPAEVKDADPIYEAERWGTSALPLLLLSGLAVITSHTDVLMLGIFRGPEEVGVYRVAIGGAGLVLFFLSPVNRVLEPLVSRLYVQGERDRLQRLVTLSVRTVFSVSLPMALGLVIFGSRILGFMFGSEFVRGQFALAILSVGQLAGVAMGSVVMLLNMTGHERATVRGVGAAAALNVVMNAVLIPFWGIEGAAVATALTMAAWNLLLARSVKQLVGIHATVLGPPATRATT